MRQKLGNISNERCCWSDKTAGLTQNAHSCPLKHKHTYHIRDARRSETARGQNVAFCMKEVTTVRSATGTEREREREKGRAEKKKER